MSEKDRAANAAARFLPYAEQDGETEALPCIEIGGVQVYAYVRDGILVISADFETADDSKDSPFLYHGGQVPVVVNMGSERIWEDLPDGYSEADAKQLRSVGEEASPVIPDWALFGE